MGDETPEFQYETLLKIERATLEFYQQRKDALISRMTPGSHHLCPIWCGDDEDDEDLHLSTASSSTD